MRRFSCILMVLVCALALLPAGIFNTQCGVFTLSPMVDGIVASTGVAVTGAELLVKHFSPKEKVYTGGQLDINDVNAFDRMFVSSYSKSMNSAANILQYTSLLLPVVLVATPNSEWGTIAVMYAESLLFSYGVKELGKSLVNRNRPYLYGDNWQEALSDDGDWNCSFPSGHVTAAFTGASFASYVFCSYFPDSPWKWPVIVASTALAGTTFALRVAGGEHFMSDAIAGAVIGTLSGIMIPYLHTLKAKQKEELKNTEFTVTPGLVACAISF